MENLFDRNTYTSTVERLHNVTDQCPPLWGKMDSAQMFAHCKEAFKVPLSEEEMPRVLIGKLLGWTVKSKLYNDAPLKPNLPTTPTFKIKDRRDFRNEKQELLNLVNRFYTSGPEEAGKFPHPVFGTFTPDQWGQSMYKHLDHHLRQFGK